MLTEKRSAGHARRQVINEATPESEDLLIRIEEERPDVFRQVILYVLDRVGANRTSAKPFCTTSSISSTSITTKSLKKT